MVGVTGSEERGTDLVGRDGMTGTSTSCMDWPDVLPPIVLDLFEDPVILLPLRPLTSISPSVDDSRFDCSRLDDLFLSFVARCFDCDDETCL
jgi:hypothetical protein